MMFYFVLLLGTFPIIQGYAMSLRNTVVSRSSNFARKMFSGIVEDMGTVEDFQSDKTMRLWDGSTGSGAELTVISKTAMEDAYIGCSIAVNGVCLTATSIDELTSKITFGLAPETLRRSNLGSLLKGNKVNIERALKANSRNSGHFVQGHVDCVGTIAKKWREGESLWLRIHVPKEYIAYIVPKGFIAIDGTSLTICDVDYTESWFTIMLISHTQTAVIVPQKGIGEAVNIEVDVLAKMVEQSIRGLNERISALEQTVDELTKK
jgi:riboflavin synthase